MRVGATDMEYRVLGPVQIWACGQPVPAGEPRQRAVLAMLLIEAGRTVSMPTLVDRIWDDEPPAQAYRSVQAHVARIRRALERAAGADCGRGGVPPSQPLVRGPGGYVLSVAGEDVDLHRFRALVARSHDAGTTDRDRAALLREALDLWLGEPLTGVAGAWAARTRDVLRQEHADVLVAWAHAEVRTGNAAAAVRPLTELLDERPTDESVAAVLMRVLYAVGRPSQALERYDRIRRTLREELGTDPGPELREVHQAVLRHDLDTAAGKSAPARAVPAQLPADVGAFTGRSAELAALASFFNAEPTTAPVIVGITGTAGVGKTALAVRWAHLVRDRYPDGQLYVNLRGYDPQRPMTPDEVLSIFLAALTPDERHLPADVEARAARYRTETAGRRMLVILDNASTVEQVRLLLPGSPGCTVLITSRSSLAGLVALHDAGRVMLSPLPTPDATSLLRRLVGSAVEDEPEASRALVRHCDGLPLALRITAELALSRPAISLAALAAELAEKQRRLELLSSGGDPRAAVRTVFSWSVQHLAVSSAQTFALVGLHPGSEFDAYAVAALADTDLDEAGRRLDRLARAHLVHRVDNRQFGMHDLLHVYATRLATAPAADPDALEPPIDAPAASRRLVDYYLAASAAAMNVLHPGEAARRPPVPPPATPVPSFPDRAAAQEWLNVELPNLVAVSAYAATVDCLTQAVQLSPVLFRYLDDGHDAAAVSVHQQARDAAHRLGDRTGEAVAMVALGAAHTQAGRYAAAVDELNRAVHAARDGGDRLAEARAVGNLGQLHERFGRYRSSGAHYRRALALYRQVGDRVGLAHALTRLGVVRARLGRHNDAHGHLRHALRLHRQAGHRFGEAWALLGLAELDARTGRPQTAAERSRQAVTQFRALGHRTSEAWALTGLGTAERLLGRYAQARDRHLHALHLFRELGDDDGQASALNGLGEAADVAGQAATALAYYRRALAIATRTGARDEQARAYAGLARVHPSGREGNADEST
jgi:DNA-binding SARP family transcriptional activator/tetratricopeptide (TPR) repeat protein